VAGAVWLIGRVLYAIGYTRAAETRHAGFGVASIGLAILWLGGA
jgi:glutathione S-transferase